MYKYVNGCDVVYVGITKNLSKRIYQHKTDKLKSIHNPVIYYFPVRERTDAELLETYLISYYKTGQHYNSAKTKKGNVSFLGNVATELPWKLWCGKLDNNLIPFVISISHSYGTSEDLSYQNTFYACNQLLQQLDVEIETEKTICNNLDSLVMGLCVEDSSYYFVKTGLMLHKKRLLCCKQIKKEFSENFIFGSSHKITKLTTILEHTMKELKNHEGVSY